MLLEIFEKKIEYLLADNSIVKIAVAVSGGVDSVALAVLLSDWSKKKGFAVTILTVNHNLRSEAKLEADYVLSLADKLGYNAFSLSWNNHGSSSNLQERARIGRYDLMTEKCQELGINILLTAHHLDDMIETYYMRKLRKSSIFGLSTSCKHFYNNIMIIRPLAQVPKVELIKYLTKQQVTWYEDDSNQSSKYQRNRVRQKIAKMNANDQENLLQEMNKVDQQVKILNDKLITAIAEIVKINNYGVAIIDVSKYITLEVAIKIQLINYVLTIISGKKNIPRYRNIEKLLDKIILGNKIACTLHNCSLRSDGNMIVIYKEKAYIDKQEIKFTDQVVWDNRFLLKAKNKPYVRNNNVYVGCLNMQDYSSIKKQIDFDKFSAVGINKHKEVLFSLPVIKNVKKIIAIPHLCYYDNMEFNDGVEIIFRPNYISRFTHFI